MHGARIFNSRMNIISWNICELEITRHKEVTKYSQSACGDSPRN